jgi:hypothetical protein
MGLEDNTLHDDIILVVERGVDGNPEMCTQATFQELLAISIRIVDIMAQHSGIEYNDILNDMKEVDPNDVATTIEQ